MTTTPVHNANLEKVAVVVLNYNGKHFLEKFLPPLLAHSGNAQIIVADNKSTDDSLQFLKEEYPTLPLIEIPQNLGFCGGYNYALAQVKADYYVLLNSDVEVTLNWIPPVINLLESNERIAACQPKIKMYDDKVKFEYAGAAGGLMDQLGYPFCRGRIFDVVEDDDGQFDDECEVFWATGACLFIRAALYHQFGGLDEFFFAHMEEIDLCWRLKNAGHQIWYCGKSEIYHVGGGTLPKSSPRKTFFNFRNSLCMIFKNLPSSQLWWIVFMRLVLDGVAGVRFLLQGELGNLMAIIRAHLAFYARIPSLLKQRKQIPRPKAGHIGQFNISIIWQHFVKGAKAFSDLPIGFLPSKSREFIRR
ncbi:MAG: glycosyltransferase family 2 protein [Flammeovirgaceae bacterium]